MKISSLMLVLLVTLGISGCTPKIEYVYVKSPVYPFKTYEVPADPNFDVWTPQKPAYDAWRAWMYGTIKALNSQIETYQKLNKE